MIYAVYICTPVMSFDLFLYSFIQIFLPLTGSSRISTAGESSRHTPRSATSLDNEVVFRRHAANLESPNAALDDGVLVNGK